jgi:pimeloyl-ACP methyl ester carboxylesterase
MSAPANVILVHGAWADGSCWSGVIERLQADGYHVTAPQFPLTALADDVARLRHARPPGQPGDRAGHSYGGQVITALGAEAQRGRLVCIAAFGSTRASHWARCSARAPAHALEHLFTDPQGFICCLRTTLSTSRPASTGSGPGCCTPPSSRWPARR